MIDGPPRISDSRFPLDWRALLCAALAGLTVFWCCTRQNSFPSYYHTDEPSKTEQLIRGQFNFRHPLLLLDATEALMWLRGAPRESQAVVEQGRTASALFAGVSAGTLALIGWAAAGPLCGVLAAVLAGTHPVLFELAHYMKEDCALLAGLSLAALGIVAYASRPTLLYAALVGLGGGLAPSGKYLGVTMSITVLLALCVIPRPDARREGQRLSRWPAIAVALAAMVLCFSCINARGLANAGRITGSLAEEMEKVERRGQERPEAIKFKHLSKLGTSFSVPLLLGFAWWMSRRCSRSAGHSGVAIGWRVLGGFVIAYFLLVSLTPKTKDRYLLPVYVFGCALGAAGIVEWTRRNASRPGMKWAGIAMGTAAVAWHVPGLVENWCGFARDDRRDLTEWLAANVPPTAGIAHDIRAHLAIAQRSGLPKYVLPNPLHAPKERYVADVGTLAELRAKGVTHIVACEADYHSAGGKDSRKGAFYAELFSTGKLVWEREPGCLAYLQPGFRVYQIVP